MLNIIPILVADEKGVVRVDDKDLFLLLSKYYHASTSQLRSTFEVVLERQKTNTKRMIVKEKEKGRIIWIYYPKKFIFNNLHLAISAYIQYLLLSKKIILLHASSIVINNYSYIFLGPSGSGKTTILKKVPQDTVLSDDIAIIKKENDIFYGYSSPFDKKKIFDFFSKKATLKKLFLLNQANTDQIVKIDYGDIIARILKDSILFNFLFKINPYNKRKNTVSSLIENLFDLTSSVEYFQLNFTKRCNILKLL